MPEKGNLVVKGILQMNGSQNEPIKILPNKNSGF